MKKQERFRSPPPVEKQTRFSIGLSVSMLAAVDECARKERRSRAFICADLIAEAVRFRKEKEADDGDQKKPSRQSSED